MKGKWLLRNNHWIFQACELGLPLQGCEIRFRIVRFSRRLRLLDPFVKASRPLNYVLVINDNYKWTNCFIEIYESRMVHR
jgi:hypothetical protein